jgi:uncharacterized protein YdeI (YjbR/CyaY-like superfamily)
LAAVEEEVGPDGRSTIHPETLEEWRAWLAAHHGRGRGTWVVSWKQATGRPAIGYEELVCEALAWGWIDSTAGTVDAERSKLWLAPRKKGSGWSRPNKRRLERLVAEGRMQPPGQSVLDAAVADGSWTLLDGPEDLVVPPDLAAALDARDGARATWESWPPSLRKQALTQLVLAKKPETRAARLARYVDAAARGARPS